MTWMPKLTSVQRQPLFELVEYQRDASEQIVFALRGEGNVEIGPWDKQLAQEIGYGAIRFNPKATIITVPIEVIQLWQNRNLVTLAKRKIDPGGLNWEESTMILNQEALDFWRRMEWRQPIRATLNLKDAWSTDLRSAIIATTFGILGALITAA
jgi:hypothetical protein